MKIFLQPEIKYDEDQESAETLELHLEEEMLKHSNINEDLVEIIILDSK